ncbi:MAG: hypothetical protein M1818_004029 [Claussenomyces sp. TS43310]|nr:MAG: hypothetical protein M1818_004029 [Claussenomyces sp. TS43310]
MAPVTTKSNPVAADLDAIQARLVVAFAEREKLVKSWMTSSSRPRARVKTQEDLDAEDAELSQMAPPHLGLGAAIPKEYLTGDIKRKDNPSNDRLRRLITGKKGALQASKPRDSQEKISSAKRAVLTESSDEEEGRSGLGKAKRAKSSTMSEENPMLKQSKAACSSSCEMSQTSPAKAKREMDEKTPPIDYAAIDDKLPVGSVGSNHSSNKTTLPPKLPSGNANDQEWTTTANLPAQSLANSIKLASESGVKRASITSSSDSDVLETEIPLSLNVGSTMSVSTTSDMEPQLGGDVSKTQAKKKKRLKNVERKRRKMAALSNSDIRT